MPKRIDDYNGAQMWSVNGTPADCVKLALNAIVDQLAAGQPLPDKNRDHALTGDYIGFRECHIRPDWLLVYRVDGEDLILFLFRTGSHTDLFD